MMKWDTRKNRTYYVNVAKTNQMTTYYSAHYPRQDDLALAKEKAIAMATHCFLEMSIENPYRVVAGFINTRFHQSIKSQISLGIEAVFHPNPLVTFVLIKVIPEFQRTLFVDYQQLKYNENEPVNDDCDSMYWSLFGNEMSGENFDYVYMLINQNPCPYGRCHYSNKTECSVFDSFEKNAISATILCNDHLMSFAEFGYGKDNGSVHYHKITNEIIIWLKQHIHSL
ncbi:uncharacterized protein LOC112687590 [Sipha flava]|uniref:Uncharacterized protein LOC112687590 n=1 Tax=Sipha flava TaxID=143950 RepID=A0A8B8FYX5_9HEMI|nr:uncharacterized protein LOC112687590 [Sipha flava]